MLIDYTTKFSRKDPSNIKNTKNHSIRTKYQQATYSQQYPPAKTSIYSKTCLEQNTKQKHVSACIQRCIPGASLGHLATRREVGALKLTEPMLINSLIRR